MLNTISKIYKKPRGKGMMVYVPGNITTDSQFPFPNKNSEIIIEIHKDTLIIKKIEEK